MPPDIRTGLPALAESASTVGTAGQVPPGSDPLAALFAALLTQSGRTQPQSVPALPKPRVGAKIDAPFPDESAPAKQTTIKPTTVKITTETIASTHQTSTLLPILPPPLLPIQMKPSQMRPIAPPTAGVTVGPKTMDTFPANAVLSQETTSAKPDGELPLQEAGSNLSGASAQFPAFLIASPSPKILTSAPALPSAPVTASTMNPSAMNPSAVVPPFTAPLGQLPAASFGQPRPFALRTCAAAQPEEPSIPVSARPTAVTQNGAPETGGALPPAVRPIPTGLYQPLSQGLTVATKVLPGAPQVPQLGITPVAPLTAVTLAVPNPAPAQTNSAQTIAVQSLADAAGQAFPSAAPALLAALPSIRPASALSRGADVSKRVTPGEQNAPKTSVNTVGIARDGSIARDGKPAREGVTATDGAKEGNAAMDGSITMDGQHAMDGTTTREGVQATEGILSTAGAAPAAPDQNGVLPTSQAVFAPSAEVPEKSLKSAVASADNNTRIAAIGVQATPAKKLPPELTLQVVGKRVDSPSEADAEIPAASLTAQTFPMVETPQAEAKPLTPADRAEIVHQVTDGIGAMRPPAKSGATEQMTLQLHPHDWGQLQISVTVTPGVPASASQIATVQTVTAHIVAQTPQVKAALENGSAELRLALRASGLHLDRMTVTVQSAGVGAQTGTASGGSHHGMNGGSFSQTASDQKTDLSGNSNPGTPSFSAFTGSHGGRQGSQAPQAYASPYQTAEPEGDEGIAVEMPRRLTRGGVDTRA